MASSSVPPTHEVLLIVTLSVIYFSLLPHLSYTAFEKQSKLSTPFPTWTQAAETSRNILSSCYVRNKTAGDVWVGTPRDRLSIQECTSNITVELEIGNFEDLEVRFTQQELQRPRSGYKFVSSLKDTQEVVLELHKTAVEVAYYLEYQESIYFELQELCLSHTYKRTIHSTDNKCNTTNGNVECNNILRQARGVNPGPSPPSEFCDPTSVPAELFPRRIWSLTDNPIGECCSCTDPTLAEHAPTTNVLFRANLDCAIDTSIYPDEVPNDAFPNYMRRFCTFYSDPMSSVYTLPTPAEWDYEILGKLSIPNPSSTSGLYIGSNKGVDFINIKEDSTCTVEQAINYDCLAREQLSKKHWFTLGPSKAQTYNGPSNSVVSIHNDIPATPVAPDLTEYLLIHPEMNGGVPADDIDTLVRYSVDNVNYFEEGGPNSVAEWVERHYGCVGRGYFIKKAAVGFPNPQCGDIMAQVQTWKNQTDFCLHNSGNCTTGGTKQMITRKALYDPETLDEHYLIPEIFGSMPRFRSGNGFPESDNIYKYLRDSGNLKTAKQMYTTLLNNAPHLLRTKESGGICGTPRYYPPPLRDWLHFVYPGPHVTLVSAYSTVKTVAWLQYISDLRVYQPSCVCESPSNGIFKCDDFFAHNCYITILVQNNGIEPDEVHFSLTSLQLLQDGRTIELSKRGYEKRFEKLDQEPQRFSVEPNSLLRLTFPVHPIPNETSKYRLTFEVRGYDESSEPTMASIEILVSEPTKCLCKDGDLSCLNLYEPYCRNNKGDSILVGLLTGALFACLSIALIAICILRSRKEYKAVFLDPAPSDWARTINAHEEAMRTMRKMNNQRASESEVLSLIHFEEGSEESEE